MISKFSLIRSTAASIALLGSALSQANFINFDDDQTDRSSIGSYYAAQGVNFSGGTWIFSFDLPGTSGSQALAGSGDFAPYIPPTTPIVLTFSTQVSSVSIEAIDVGFAGVIMNAYDAPIGGNLVGTSSFVGLGVGEGNFSTLMTAGTIFRVELSQLDNNGVLGDGIIFDDLKYTPVPEPASIAALGIGALAMFRRRQRK